MIKAIQIAAVNMESECTQESHMQWNIIQWVLQSFPSATTLHVVAAKRTVFTDTRQCPGRVLKSYCLLLPQGNSWGTRDSSPSVLELRSCLSSKMLISKAFHEDPSSGVPSLARSEHHPKPCFDHWNVNFHLKATVWRFMLLLMVALM